MGALVRLHAIPSEDVDESARTFHATLSAQDGFLTQQHVQGALDRLLLRLDAQKALRLSEAQQSMKHWQPRAVAAAPRLARRSETDLPLADARNLPGKRAQRACGRGAEPSDSLSW